MSETSTLVTAEHFRYIAERTTPEDDFLRRLKEAARAEGIPAIWIAPEQAALMQILLRAANVREVVEVGTLAGCSAIAMARALPPEGRVRTIEIDPKHADFAQRWIDESDVAGKIEIHRGDARRILQGFESVSADAAFIDADKSGYPVYLDECLRILRPRGLVLVDNAFAFGQLFDESPSESEVGAVRAFNDRMAKDDALDAVIVPLGDGLWVGVKRG